MSEFIRPEVSVEEISDNLARVTAEPLERGYGDTLGNSLRRVLLSSLEGAAVQAIQIDGVQHEFTTVPGVYEDVTDIVLNVKGLVFRDMGTGDEAVATINIDGPAKVTGGDFVVPAEFELVNPEHLVCTLGEGAHLTMQMRIGTGRGYVSGDRNERPRRPFPAVCRRAMTAVSSAPCAASVLHTLLVESTSSQRRMLHATGGTSLHRKPNFTTGSRICKYSLSINPPGHKYRREGCCIVDSR